MHACIPLSNPQPNVSDTILNNSHGKIPTNTTPSKSCHVPTTPFGVVIQFGVLMVENYVHHISGVFKRQLTQQLESLVVLLLMQTMLLDVQHS
jgi:hypothetical protein